MEIIYKRILLEIKKWNEAKHFVNFPYELLTMCCYFGADLLFKTSQGFCLTQDNVGDAYKRPLLENLSQD